MVKGNRLYLVVISGLAALLQFSQAAAQAVSPERVGLSSERLTRIESLMQRHIDAGDFAGAVTLVARGDQIAWFRAQGVMDVTTGRPMQKDTVFRIMSMTKPVVAVSVLMLLEEGRVRLNDPVSKFIPELGGLPVVDPNTPGGVKAEREILIKDLLTHTSGLMSGTASDSTVAIEFAPGDTLASVLPRLAGSQLEFQPGSRWAYSPMFGFDALARVVEVCAGVSFETFVEERILAPLAMNNTYFYRDTPHPDLAKLYRKEDGKLVATGDMPFANGAYFSGGGGLFSTAGDYLRFALMLLNDGELNGKRLLGRRTAERMRSAFIPDSLPGRRPGQGYGLGVFVVTDAVQRNTWASDGSFGWAGVFGTYFFIDPVERIVGIYMTQVAGFQGSFTLMDDFETAVMQAVIK